MDINKTNDKRKIIITILLSLIIATLSGIMSYFHFPQRLEYMA